MTEPSGSSATSSRNAASPLEGGAIRPRGSLLAAPWPAVFLLGSVGVLLFLLYSGSFKGPLIFDSYGNILLVSPMHMEELSLEDVKSVIAGAHIRQRPVANLSLALNFYFSGTQARGYRIVNVLIHLVTGVLLFLLIRVTLETPALSQRNLPRAEIAFFAALLWLLHPLAVQSVAYVVQRMNSQAAMFYILALWLYVRARLALPRRRKGVLTFAFVLAGLLALGSKEIAATLPIFVLLYEWYFFQDLNAQWLKRAAGAVMTGAIAFGVASLAFAGRHPIDRILSGYTSRDFTMVERLLTEARVVVYYLSLLVFPHPSRLNLDHDFSLSKSLLAPPSTLLSVGFLATLLIVALLTAKKHRLFSFGVLWYLGNLVIESSFVPLEIVFEHRTYLPSMFLSPLFVLVVFKLLPEANSRRAVLLAIAAVLSLWTYQRATIWGDDLALWQDVVAKSPNKSRPHHNLGVVLRERQLFQEAIPHFRRAIELDPTYGLAYLNLGHALMHVGDTTEALKVYTEGVGRAPSNAKLHFDRSLALAKIGRTREEIEELREANRLKADDPNVLNNLGATLLTQGQIDEAIEILTRAVEIQPRFARAHFNLGQALKAVGRTEEGDRHLAAAQRLRAASAH